MFTHYEFRHIGGIQVVKQIGIVNHHMTSDCVYEQPVIHIAHGDCPVGINLLDKRGCETVAHPHIEFLAENIGLRCLIFIRCRYKHHSRQSGALLHHPSRITGLDHHQKLPVGAISHHLCQSRPQSIAVNGMSVVAPAHGSRRCVRPRKSR